MSSIHADLCVDFDTEATQASDVYHKTESWYNGRSVTLLSARQDDGTWVCEYTVLEFRPLYAFSESGYPVGSFTTHDAAEAVALEVAQAVINSRDPINALTH
jgi:hypothetical protein